MQGAQLRPGFDPELVDENGAGLGVGGQGLGSAAGCRGRRSSGRPRAAPAAAPRASAVSNSARARSTGARGRAARRCASRAARPRISSSRATAAPCPRVRRRRRRRGARATTPAASSARAQMPAGRRPPRAVSAASAASAAKRAESIAIRPRATRRKPPASWTRTAGAAAGLRRSRLEQLAQPPARAESRVVADRVVAPGRPTSPRPARPVPTTSSRRGSSSSARADSSRVPPTGRGAPFSSISSGPRSRNRRPDMGSVLPGSQWNRDARSEQVPRVPDGLQGGEPAQGGRVEGLPSVDRPPFGVGGEVVDRLAARSRATAVGRSSPCIAAASAKAGPG